LPRFFIRESTCRFSAVYSRNIWIRFWGACQGRKNWLFAGSVAGGERIAGFLTLASSAHRNDIDVRAYIHDVLKRLLAGETDYEPMLPWNWANEHPENIRQYRQSERRDRSDRKQSRRDQRRVRERILQRRPHRP
jgi:hypothetical protein